MADIATIFHWSPQLMEVMDIGELRKWHAMAIERFKLVHDR